MGVDSVLVIDAGIKKPSVNMDTWLLNGTNVNKNLAAVCQASVDAKQKQCARLKIWGSAKNKPHIVSGLEVQ